jgi:hypothetical protein
MSGVAYHGTREITVPRSLGYLGFAIFCHEIGHIVLGHCDKKNGYTGKIRCIEEYEAWKFAQSTFKELGIPFKRRIAARMNRSLSYAKKKALRRGLKIVPVKLRAY